MQVGSARQPAPPVATASLLTAKLLQESTRKLRDSYSVGEAIAEGTFGEVRQLHEKGCAQALSFLSLSLKLVRWSSWEAGGEPGGSPEGPGGCKRKRDGPLMKAFWIPGPPSLPFGCPLVPWNC